MKKSINLIGENRDTTIIDGEHLGYVVNVDANWVNISGFTIRNSDHLSYAISIVDNNSITIADNNIFNNGAGIGFLFSDNNIIKGNNILSNKCYGINLDWSISNTITSNNISNNEYGIYNWFKSDRNTITDNNISNNDYGICIIIGCYWNTITDNNISNNYYGIYLNDRCNNNVISDNTISSNNQDGIYLSDSTKNTISGNSFFNDGLYVDNSYQNTVSNNTVNGKPLVYLEEESDTIIDVDAGQVIFINCDNITIQNQEISNTDVGIELWDTSNCLMSGNTISNNGQGIRLDSSSNNIIYHNNFINNTQNAYDECDNTWDDGKYGNYWSDYKEKYPDAKPRLLKPWMWNTPYEIPGWYNKDTCPLIKQWPNSKPRTISRNTASYSSCLLRFLDRFPILQKTLLYLIK